MINCFCFGRSARPKQRSLKVKKENQNQTYTPIVVDLGFDELMANVASQATGLATTFAYPLGVVGGVILFAIGVNYGLGWLKRAGKAKA